MLLSCRTWPLCPDRVKEPSCYWITAAQENKPKPKTSLFGLSSHLCPGGAAPSARAGADPSGIWLCPGAHSLLAGLQRSRSDLSAISRGTGDRGSPRHGPARPGRRSFPAERLPLRESGTASTAASALPPSTALHNSGGTTPGSCPGRDRAQSPSRVCARLGVGTEPAATGPARSVSRCGRDGARGKQGETSGNVSVEGCNTAGAARAKAFPLLCPFYSFGEPWTKGEGIATSRDSSTPLTEAVRLSTAFPLLLKAPRQQSGRAEPGIILQDDSHTLETLGSLP